MLVRVDKEADAFYLQLSDEEVDSSEEVSDGVILDYTTDGHLVGIEILDTLYRAGAAPSKISPPTSGRLAATSRRIPPGVRVVVASLKWSQA